MFVSDTIPGLITKIKADANKLAQIFHSIFVIQQHKWAFIDGLKVPTVTQLEEMFKDLLDEISEDNLESCCGGINIRISKTEDFANPFYIGEIFYVPVYDSFE